jgi:predicted transcriptional regulator
MAKNVLSKVPLGHEFELDFVLEEDRFILVEIKKPDAKLFTEKGDETAVLRRAKAQMETYQRWISEHLGYIREQFPGMYSPYGIIIIGLNKTMSEYEKRRLEQSNITTRSQYEIITYDALLERGKNLLRNLS